MRPARRRAAPVPADRDAGAAAVEFALVAPLLILLMFGILGLGWGLWERQAAQAAVREVARLASEGGFNQAGFVHEAACLNARNTLAVTRLTHLDLRFFHLTSAGLSPLSAGERPGTDDYVQITLTYTSAMAGLPLVTVGSSDGVFTATALSRIEVAPGVTDPLSQDMTGQVCS
jgi:Flp pilus assembly protein TadG